MYGDALDGYKDALSIWSLKFVPSTQMYYRLIGHDNGLVFPDRRHSRIIARYGIPYAPSEGREVKAISGDQALKRIWEAAGSKLDAANKALRASGTE
jgi:hypothetical protein